MLVHTRVQHSLLIHINGSGNVCWEKKSSSSQQTFPSNALRTTAHSNLSFKKTVSLTAPNIHIQASIWFLSFPLVAPTHLTYKQNVIFHSLIYLDPRTVYCTFGKVFLYCLTCSFEVNVSYF